MYIWFYFRVAASHKAFPRCYTRFIIQSSPSETVTPKNTHSFGVPMDSQQAKDFPHFHPFLQPSLPFSLMALQRWKTPSNNKTTGTLLASKRNCFFNYIIYSITDYCKWSGRSWRLWIERNDLFADFLHTEMKDLDDWGYSLQAALNELCHFPWPPSAMPRGRRRGGLWYRSWSRFINLTMGIQTNQPFLQRAETKNYATAEFTKLNYDRLFPKKCCVLRRLLVEK